MNIRVTYRILNRNTKNRVNEFRQNNNNIIPVIKLLVRLMLPVMAGRYRVIEYKNYRSFACTPQYFLIAIVSTQIHFS